MKEQFTQAPWLNEGTTVYALQDCKWLGMPSKSNRFQFFIQGKCSDEELLANAVLAKASPKMYRMLDELAKSIELNKGNCTGLHINLYDKEILINRLLAEARGEKSDTA